MQIMLYGFNATTFRFTIEVNDKDYTFSFPEGSLGTNFRDADNKLVARTYKGFRNRLGIAAGSNDANTLITEIKKASQALAAHEYNLKKRATTKIERQAVGTVMTWRHSETQFAAMPVVDTLDPTPDPIFYGATREAAIAAYQQALSMTVQKVS